MKYYFTTTDGSVIFANSKTELYAKIVEYKAGL